MEEKTEVNLKLISFWSADRLVLRKCAVPLGRGSWCCYWPSSGWSSDVHEWKEEGNRQSLHLHRHWRKLLKKRFQTTKPCWKPAQDLLSFFKYIYIFICRGFWVVRGFWKVPLRWRTLDSGWPSPPLLTSTWTASTTWWLELHWRRTDREPFIFTTETQRASGSRARRSDSQPVYSRK